jgi:hypothetical protein
LVAARRQLPEAVAISRRRWGYVVWGVALGFIFIPEILAALPLTESQLPFPTISKMTGHLEYEHAEWEIFPTMMSVFVLYALWRVPPRKTSGGRTAEQIAARRTRGDTRPHRTPGGRLTFAAAPEKAAVFDNEVLRDVLFALRALAVALAIALITLWAFHHWPNQYVTSPDGQRTKQANYHVAYFLYGSIGFFWLLLPSITGFVKGKDAEFPSLFRTIANLEEWIGRPRPHPASDRIGTAVAWLVSFILVWGMVFLMMHLTLYPFPNITHILNHGG